MSSTSLTQFARDPDAAVDGLRSVLLQYFNSNASYVSSYWSGALQLRAYVYTFEGATQLLINTTNASGDYSSTFSTWAEDSKLTPISLTTNTVASSAIWSTFTLITSNDATPAGSQLTLALDTASLYAPTTVENVLAANHPVTGSVSLLGDLVQDHVVTLSNTLTDIDGLSSPSYEWQKRGATAADVEGNWAPTGGADLDHFTPGVNEAGSFLRVKITYTDGLGYQETVTSQVSSSAVIANHAPTALPSEVFSGHGEVYTFKPTDFGFSDVDVGDTLAGISLLSLPATGQLTWDGQSLVIPVDGFSISASDWNTHTLQFTPSSTSTSLFSESLSFLVVDNHQTASAPSTLTLNEDNRPTSSNSAMDGEINTPIDITPESFSFFDIDNGDSLQSITITQLPSHGDLTLRDRLTGEVKIVATNTIISALDLIDYQLSYHPNSSAAGTEHLQFKVSDGYLESSSAYDLQFNVTNPAGGTAVSGDVLHWKGLTPVPISGVSVAIGSNTPVSTDTAGHFSLAGADLSLGSQVSPVVATPFASKADAGITLTDVLATLKVYLGRELPADYASPFNVVAADFDGNGVVNLSDVLGLLKYYLGRPTSSAPTWAFVDATDVVTVNGQTQIMGANGVALSKSNVNLDPSTLSSDPTAPVHLFGVIRGDVDGSWALAHPPVI